MKFILFYVTLLFTAQAHAWVMNVNFEKGNDGSEAQGSDAFTDAFSNTKYTSKVVHGGSLAAVTSIKEGEKGFGDWGGTLRFPSQLGDGDQVWFRAWLYYPAGFDFSNDGIGVKTLRIRTKSPDVSDGGHFDMLTNGSAGITAYIEQTGKEFVENNSQWKNLGPPITTGVWHAFEMYAKLSPVSGKGVFRLWVDGQLVLEDTSTATLKKQDQVAVWAYLWSYFNGGSGKDQKAYVDDLIITNETPSALDSAGNRFIGVGNASFIAAPKSATLN